MKIAWIGTGVMGAPMAKHLAKAGHQVNAYNRTYVKAKALEPEIRAFESLEECVQDVDAVFSIVGYPKDVEEIYQRIFKAVKKETILVDMTTSSPTLAKTLAEQALASDLYMLDAPVTGGDLGAINATLSIMVGGDETSFNKLRSCFESLGTTVTYMGNSGNGQYTKLANQVVIAGNIVGIAEAISFARAHNLPVDSFMSVINGGSAASWQAKINGQKMIDDGFKPGFFIKHFLKDLRLVIDEKQDLDLTMVPAVIRIYEKLVDDGLENEGTQAIIKYYQSIK